MEVDTEFGHTKKQSPGTEVAAASSGGWPKFVTRNGLSHRKVAIITLNEFVKIV